MKKSQFEVIDGGKEKKYNARKELRQKKSDIWKKMFLKSTSIHKAVVCGVKYISYADINTETGYDELNIMIVNMDTVTMALSMITYNDLMRLFPIRKDFDGRKYEAKDYWSTMEWLEGKDLDAKIGDDVDDMLWSYYNDDIMQFGIKKLLIVDKVRKASGRRSVMEDFIDFINKDAPPEQQIHTYSINREEGYIYDNMTGKTQPLITPKRKKPDYLKVIK